MPENAKVSGKVSERLTCVFTTDRYGDYDDNEDVVMVLNDNKKIV